MPEFCPRKLRHRREAADPADTVLSEIYIAAVSTLLPVYSELFSLCRRGITETGILDGKRAYHLAAVAL